MAVRARAVVAIMLIGALSASWHAHAALTCEQVYAIAQAALRYRDQGYSLDQVLAGLKAVDAESKLTPAELEVLRRAVTLTYLGHATPGEIALECAQTLGAQKP